MVVRKVSLFSFVSGAEASANVFACSVLLGTTMMVAYISKKYRWVYFPESCERLFSSSGSCALCAAKSSSARPSPGVGKGYSLCFERA